MGSLIEGIKRRLELSSALCALFSLMVINDLGRCLIEAKIGRLAHLGRTTFQAGGDRRMFDRYPRK